MVDPFVSFSNPNSLDIFPSFKSFHDDQGAFTIDTRDREEMKKPIRTKRNTTTADTTKKSNLNPSVQCDICLVLISSQIVYDIHIKGRKHQTQLAALLAKKPQYKTPTYEELCSKKLETITFNDPNDKSESSVSELTVPVPPPLVPTKILNCTLCNAACNSQQMFDNHLSGKKHQMKLKVANLTSPAPPLHVPVDHSSSSSNYCDICSLKLNSEDELTEHLSQKKHQTRMKEAEICAKEAVDMNINFDDYKIDTIDTNKDNFNYQCTVCNKKFTKKIPLIEHLKSALHIRLSNRSNKPRISRNSDRGNHQAIRRGVVRGGPATRSQTFSSSRGLNKPPRQSRPYRPQRSSWDQPSQSFDQQTSTNPFGAFDPNNQYYYSPTKRSTQYEDIPSEYPTKRSRTYNDEGNKSQDFYPNDGNYYSSSTLTNHPSNSDQYTNDQSSISQPTWHYQTDPYYDQQQYSNSGAAYVNPMYYPPSQPPLPNYEPPPLPTYPPPISHSSYSSNPAFYSGTENQETNDFFPTSFHH